jgi:hypothetical protein
MPLLALMFRSRRLFCGEFARAAGPVGRGRLDEVHEGVVEEHGIAGWAVYYAVENVGYNFALRIVSQSLIQI